MYPSPPLDGNIYQTISPLVHVAICHLTYKVGPLVINIINGVHFPSYPDDFGPLKRVPGKIPIKKPQYQVLWIWIHTHHTRIWLDPHRWFGLPL